MFNALTAPQLLTGVGRTLRMAADAQGPLEGYERSQLLSTYSLTRLYASELSASDQLLADSRSALLGALAQDERPDAERARVAIAEAADGLALGEALVALLETLPRPDATRTHVHAALREMIDQEVAALDAPVG